MRARGHGYAEAILMQLFLFGIASAQHPWQVKIGGNYSYLKNPSYCEPGKF